MSAKTAPEEPLDQAKPRPVAVAAEEERSSSSQPHRIEQEHHVSRASSDISLATDDNVDKGSWLEVATETINNHLRVVRLLPWVMGGVGALLIARYSRMFTQYHRTADVPSHLLSQGATLRGVAVGAWPDGRLDVWHSPPGRRWLRWKHKPPKLYTSDQVLGVRLAAVAFAQPEAAHSWLISNLIGRSVWLRLLHYSPRDQCLHCIVDYRKGAVSRLCLNTKLISLGLAKLEEPVSDHLGNNEELIAFLSDGVKTEEGARKRGEGVWRGSQYEARWRKVARFLRLRT